MATKLQYTPTTNLFALLADEQAQAQQSAKKATAQASAPAPKSPQQELTPKARAEAKAQAQDAERKKKEAEKKPALAQEASDLNGFSLQRNQRVKEKRQATVEETKEAPKGNKKPFKGDRQNKGDKTFSGDKDDKVFKEKNRQPRTQGGGGFKGDKKPQSFKGDGNDTRPPRREFDKHSQGKFSRQPQAKRQGHGKGNWGEATETAEQQPEEPTTVPATTTVDDDWGAPAVATDDQVPVEGEAPTQAEDQNQDQEKEKEKEPEQPKELGLDDYFKLQAEKKKALEALVGAGRGVPRSLTDEEKRNLKQFTLVENTKPKVTPAKEASKDPKAPKETPKDTPAAKAQARKGEKAVPVDTLFNVQVPNRVRAERNDRERGDRGDSRGRGRGGRGRGGGRGNGGNPRPQGDNQGQTNSAPSEQQRAPRPAKGPGPGRGGKTQKIVRNESQFPSLG